MSYDYDGDGTWIAAIIAIYAVFLLLYLVILIAYYVLMGFALMSFFRKVGVEPWIAWVPYYNSWKWLEVGGQQGWFALLSLVPFGGYVYLVFHGISMYRTGKSFGKDGAWVVLGLFLPFVWAFILGGKDEVYRPETHAAFGWPPPLAGFGATPTV
jgi:hypothetical protein